VSILLEAYVTSAVEALAAEDAGAGRIELCGPGEGGLTPSETSLLNALSLVHVPVHVMIRPREGDFVYSDAEFAQMREGVRMAKQAGARGVVFGVLHADSTLDVARMRELMHLARPLKVGCHRAFDRTPDADAALDALIALGVHVVLTSGHAATALEGAATLKRHVARAGDRISVLAGGTVRATNARALIAASGVSAVHARGLDHRVIAELAEVLSD
jgi:copper homeostasis protein